MKTINELVEMVEKYEGELAYGSETTLLGDFVNAYDCTGRLREQRGKEEIEDHEFEAWENAYKRMEKYEADGVEYDSDMLWC